jgi:hypothetical protein
LIYARLEFLFYGRLKNPPYILNPDPPTPNPDQQEPRREKIMNSE